MPSTTETSKKNSLVATIFPSGQPNHSGSQTAQLKVIPPKDIVMFVAGTTDPSNTSALNHQANKEYWRNVKEDQKNLWKSIKELKPQYLDLHIEDTFFSWSGDNNHNERVKAAERLLDLFMRVYPNWKDKSVHLHLIGHSHGGNVINEFTNTIVHASNFPKKWKIKSLTYLSTPFFQKQHQLNHSKLHPNCKIINVHNDYDLTQRVIADFTLKNLEILINNVDKVALKKALDRIDKANFETISSIASKVFLSRSDMVNLWNRTSILLDGVEQVVAVWVNNIKALEGKTTILHNQKRELIATMNEIRTWATTRRVIIKNRLVELRAWSAAPRATGFGSSIKNTVEDNRFTRFDYIEDINILGLLPTLNTLLDIPKGFGNKDFFGAYLIDMLSSIVTADNSGISDIIDDTTTTPKKQVNGAFKIIDIPITDQDKFNSRSTKKNFAGFIEPLEMCVRAKRPDTLHEILIRLLSQLVPIDTLSKAITFMDWVVQSIVTDDDNDDQLDILQKNLERYLVVIKKFNANLVTKADQENKTLLEKPGSIAYLAMVSHSLSHTKLFDKVKQELTSSFSSGKNPGYKPEKK